MILKIILLSGLIYLMFYNPQAKVIEIFQGFSNSIFYYLSQLLKLEHFAIKIMNIEKIHDNQNTYVDPAIIQDFINKNQRILTK
ncbi:hypothetical protein HYV11_00905 [Candidatus Dependentiae bacterium]|nr:hypothetical protein [Candidatus Dependentiae bacterium]